MSEPRPSPLVQLVLARIRAYTREPSTVFWAFGFPIAISIALAIAFRSRPPEPVIVAVEDPIVRAELIPDHGIDSREMDHANALAALRSGRVALVVEVGTPRTYRYDPTRAEGRLARAVVDDRLQRAEGRIDPTPTDDAVVEEPGARYIDFLFPALIATGLMGSGLWGIGFVVVEMRTRKLLKRLAATPMRRSDFLLSFVIARAAVLVIELPVLLLFAHFAFRVELRGSLLALVITALAGAIAFAGTGLLVASRARNTETVSGLINLVSMPMYLCSGVFFSASRFPEFMQPIIRALPLTALNDALRAVMNDGAGILGVGRELAILGAWSLGLFAVTLRLFRWR